MGKGLVQLVLGRVKIAQKGKTYGFLILDKTMSSILTKDPIKVRHELISYQTPSIIIYYSKRIESIVIDDSLRTAAPWKPHFPSNTTQHMSTKTSKGWQ